MADRLAARGVEVADADRIARDVAGVDGPAFRPIVERFGSRIVGADGGFDRRALREIVFADVEARRALEAIIHPLVREALRRFAGSARGLYCVVVIPLLAEGSRYPWIDHVVVVDAPDDVRIARLMARDSIDRALAESMLAAQASRAARLAIADSVIVNDSASVALDRQVKALDAKLRALSSRR